MHDYAKITDPDFKITEEIEKEVELFTREINVLFRRLQNRDADPMVVSSLAITRFVTLARQLFDDEEEYKIYIDSVVAIGTRDGSQLFGTIGETYVH